MDTKTFLERVTAPQDSLVVAVLKADGTFWNRRSFTDVAAAAQAILAWDTDPTQTIYYSVGRFANNDYIDDKGRPKVRRTADLATAFKALALDLDCGPGKPYPDARTGTAALLQATRALALPEPMLVASGRGVHVYWPLQQTLDTRRWELISIALRLALASQQVVIDNTKIHDPSMVLRPVGSHHKKQTPHVQVRCVRDCPDYDAVELAKTLAPWAAAAKAFKANSSRPAARGNKPRSAIMAAVLDTGDIVLENVLQKCNQLAALAATGGVTDSSGAPVEEPMWRASLGFAKYCVDQQAAVLTLAGQHPDFDLDENMAKMSAWHGSGPTTCAQFEQLNPTGCAGCPHKSQVRSPASLNISSFIQAPPEDDAGAYDEDGAAESAVEEIELPRHYVVRDNRIYLEEETFDERPGPNGNPIKMPVTQLSLVSNYLIYITGVYADHGLEVSTARARCRYPLGNWKEFDLPLAKLAAAGKEFAEFMINKMIYLPSQASQNSMREYLMRYLEMVQAKVHAGGDFEHFGWQPDGTFLCGHTVHGENTAATTRRLKGAAARYGELLRPAGSRDEWVNAMALLKHPGAMTVASTVLIGTVGVLGRVSGNSSFLLSIYSPKTSTGKTLSLLAANSLAGQPRKLLMGVTDTANAIYKVRGTLNHLPGTIDEITTLPAEDAVDLAYNLSSGREKLALSREREIRQPVTWDGPTIVTCNYSLHAKFAEVMSVDDPVRARTLEITQHDYSFVTAHGNEFHRLITDNYGWALPELVDAVLGNGGDRVVWERGLAAFEKKFAVVFEPSERFYKSAVVGAWIMGRIGRSLGLFPFDIDAVTQHLIDAVLATRQRAIDTRLDAFDIVGQYLQEHHDQLIECREEYTPGTKNPERVQYPVPERAVARLHIVHDSAHPVLPGSSVSINHQHFKTWLRKTRDNVQRVTDELAAAGALIAERDRVTLYRGCSRANPGQAVCLVINVNHPRFSAALTAARARQPSPVALAVIQGGVN